MAAKELLTIEKKINEETLLDLHNQLGESK
jgi:hypothetical protein